MRIPLGATCAIREQVLESNELAEYLEGIGAEECEHDFLSGLFTIIEVDCDPYISGLPKSENLGHNTLCPHLVIVQHKITDEILELPLAWMRIFY